MSWLFPSWPWAPVAEEASDPGGAPEEASQFRRTLADLDSSDSEHSSGSSDSWGSSSSFGTSSSSSGSGRYLAYRSQSGLSSVSRPSVDSLAIVPFRPPGALPVFQARPPLGPASTAPGRNQLYFLPQPRPPPGPASTAPGRTQLYFLPPLKGTGKGGVLINHKILADRLSSMALTDQYDLFMFTRSDFLHVVPFPAADDLLRCVGRGDVLTQAGHEFGGVNYNLAIARADTALRYLLAPYETIAGRSLPNRQKTYNIELFWRVIFGQRSLRNLRMPVTCFVTAESVHDRTSWRKILHSEEHNVTFKYQVQMEETRSHPVAEIRVAAWEGPRSVFVVSSITEQGVVG
ncbi:unnamed protein product [Symbiodinium natans]|uniref:Uncharacterized protein n=1 Tax=Symbiodinium natans TaxID=878477 RepID=A0A812RGK3_9DINO|nr:unnamed protein product [Symbiodinium natans]